VPQQEIGLTDNLPQVLKAYNIAFKMNVNIQLYFITKLVTEYILSMF